MDLHEIYEGNPGCPPVFQLSSSDQERKRNLFQLVVQMEFIDGTLSQKFTSPIFNLRAVKDKDTIPGKRYFFVYTF